jgi:hypothetical protein
MPRCGNGLALFFLFFVLIVPSGCNKEVEKPGKELLLERVKEYWNLKVADDYVGAYEFIDPESREELTLADFAAFAGEISYTKVEVVDAKLTDNGTKATVELNLVYVSHHPQMQGAGEIPYNLEEPWLVADGNWYRKWESPFRIQLRDQK